MMNVDASAVPAIFQTPPDYAHPSGDLVAWLTDPPGIVVQFARPARGSRELVSWLVDDVEPRFAARFPDRKDLVFVLDLRNMTSREGAARSLLLERAPAFRERFSRTFIVPPLGGAFVTMWIQAAAAVLRTFGIPVEVERSLARVHALCGVRALGAA